MMSAKLATLGFLKKQITWNKGYDVIISIHEVTNEILSRDSNYVVDVVTWPKFGNSTIFRTEVIITSILQRFHQKNQFFFFGGGFFCFKFNDLELALDMILKFYTSVVNSLKQKVRKF